ncbi:MAG: hypothetical protein HGA33_00280 [Candidatus Moranbacteria bacterium]|nr:hypothetical protein [Candidatus Moranbacteria bacterium]
MTRAIRIGLIYFGTVLFGLLGYLAFVMYGRMHSDSDPVGIDDEKNGSASTAIPLPRDSGDDMNEVGKDADVDEDAADEEELIKETEEETSFLDISSTDCTKRCAGYDGDDFEYCQEVCGLSADDPGYHEEDDDRSTDDKVSDDCDGKSGLALDYCRKDTAVANGNLSACTGISDTGIRKACRNRIAQDLMESTP